MNPTLSVLALVCGATLASAQVDTAANVSTNLEASAPSTVLTPRLMAEIQQVTQAAISPDANFIAFVKSVPRTPGVDDDGGNWGELHVADRGTGETRPFVTGEVNVRSVRWTPDGKGIAFLSKRDGDDGTSLYVIPIDGGEARRAVGLKSSVLDYSFNSDGSLVAIVATEPKPEEEEKLEKKGFKQEIYEEDFRHRRVYVATPFGDNEDLEPVSIEGSVFDVEWSPVDDRLACAVAPTPLVDDSYMAKTIHIFNTAGEHLTAYEKRGKLGEIRWSPDGKQLAIVAGADINDPTNGRLMLAATSGGTFNEVLPGWEGDTRHIWWQNDKSVFVLGSEGVASVFGTVDVTTGVLSPIYRAENSDLGSFALSGDGQSASFTVSSPTHPTELYTMSHGDDEPSRITNSNPWLDELQLGKQEVVTYNARDGQDIQGILVHPIENSGGPVPLVLVVHGGPESHYRNGWMSRYANPAQILAARGFATFFPNYRGSTGRGLNFAKLSQGDPAGKEFDDCVDGVDALVELGLVDKDKVGVTGGSYGGYATAWMSTYYSDRFAAGVMFVGISDKVSKWGTTDIPEEEFHVHARHRIWDEVDGKSGWNFFLERSPIYYADRNQTALLILHGKEDPRVDPGQSRELYRHVKTRGNAPVRLVYYPGEGHGNRKAAAKFDYCLRMLRWMKIFLQDGGTEAPAHEIDYPEATAQADTTPDPIIRASDTRGGR